VFDNDIDDLLYPAKILAKGKISHSFISFVNNSKNDSSEISMSYKNEFNSEGKIMNRVEFYENFKAGKMIADTNRYDGYNTYDCYLPLHGVISSLS
jgi:hypothetical protein